ncbi:hypothetical protein ES332_D03G136700v1 [Gossypium tomentosum]|uniref:Uncharacterized protein n=1 Tax=Gossypium tomentosum TaxID=34277 RepID=A0A5D2LMD7_GOSTO|nr:hypothetical protein ES332_D03G136700v1 [Gossypium tomentosum]
MLRLFSPSSSLFASFVGSTVSDHWPNCSAHSLVGLIEVQVLLHFIGGYF